MKTPPNAFWLAILALALAATSGHRTLECLVLSDYIRDLNDEPILNGAGPVLGSEGIPLFAVPVTVFAVIVFAAVYPDGSIKLFQWTKGGILRQIFWTVVCCLPILFNSLYVVLWMHSIYRLVIGDRMEFVPDAVYNLVAGLGAIYFWLCFRAVTCHRESCLAMDSPSNENETGPPFVSSVTAE